ncbi:hypothetical protein ONZ45_g16043 [Pleurotus djamor]|nr:hypothetical protein ONZ45_g16043 [Pleurotus djamor]
MASQSMEHSNISTDVQSANWCELSARLLAGASYGIPAATLAINRRLYIISRNATTGMPSPMRVIMADIGIGLFVPAVFTALISLPQGHRSNILEDLGCLQPYYNTIPAIMIQALPPLVIAVISGIYGGINAYTLYKRQADLKRLLAATTGRVNIDFSEYYRLFCLGLLDVIFTIPLASWMAYHMITNNRIFPWNWYDVKFEYELIWVYPREKWQSSSGVEFLVGQWLFVLCAMTFFIFFGCNKESRDRYVFAVRWLGQRCFGIPMPSKSLEPLAFQRYIPTSRRVTRHPDPLDMTFNSSVSTLPSIHDPSTDHEPHLITNFTFGSFSLDNLGLHWNRSNTSIPAVPHLLAVPTDDGTQNANSSERSLASTAVQSSASITAWRRLRSLVGVRSLADTLRTMLGRNPSSTRQVDEEKGETQNTPRP